MFDDIKISFEGFAKKPLTKKQVEDIVREDLAVFFKEGYAEFTKAMIEAFGDNANTSGTGVDTGMTLGSVQTLASAVGATGPLERRKAEIRRGAYYSEGIVKSFSEGLRLGKGAYKLDLGDFNEDTYLLDFEIVKPQHERWEPTWDSLGAGARAFDEYVSANIKKVFDIDKILQKII
jgi:hypothetical protein